MDEYLGRESIYKTLSMEKPIGWNNDDLAELFREAKPADVAPVRHGEWILGHVEPGYFTPGGNRPWICSKCKQVVSWSLARPEYNYCHNCGAKMDGDG